MQAYYEIETDIPNNHQLNLVLPDEIPEGKAKVAIIYELPNEQDEEALATKETGNSAGLALKSFLKKYQSEQIDIDMDIFEKNRKNETGRDFKL